jgi:hypothetical protein
MKVNTSIKAGTIQTNYQEVVQGAVAQLGGSGLAFAQNIAVLTGINISVQPSISLTIG